MLDLMEVAGLVCFWIDPFVISQITVDELTKKTKFIFPATAASEPRNQVHQKQVLLVGLFTEKRSEKTEQKEEIRNLIALPT